MWSGIRTDGRRVVGVTVGVIIAALVILEGADKIWPGYFHDREAVQLRRSVLDSLVRSNETTAANRIWVSLIVRRLREVPPARMHKLVLVPERDDGAERFAHIPLRPSSIVGLDVEAVSGKTGLIGGRKFDFRATCLPALGNFHLPAVAEGYVPSVEKVHYSNIRISRIGPEGEGKPDTSYEKATALSVHQYELLSSKRSADQRIFIREFGSGCYRVDLTRDGEVNACVVALAISAKNLGRGSVTATKCRIEAEY